MKSHFSFRTEIYEGHMKGAKHPPTTVVSWDWIVDGFCPCMETRSVTNSHLTCNKTKTTQ